MPAVSAAIGFLTRVPVRGEITARDVARGAPLFPFVGAAIGAMTAGVALLAHLALSPFLSAVLAIATATAVTGALHLDGLADTADGLGGYTHERRLEIMRDSRIGTFGAAAVGLDLLIKVGAVEQLVSRGLLPALVVAGALSRAAAVLLAGWGPYARESGTGNVLGRPSRLALAICLPAAPVVALLRPVYRRLFGGVTGDILGATVELTELLVLVVAAAVT